MKFAKPKPPSPAEQRLADAQKAKEDASAEMQRQQAVIDRLDRQIRAAAPAEAALARLDADQSTRLATWAADPNAGDPPQSDWQLRERLQRELSAARATAASAASAKATPSAALTAAGARSSAAQRAAWVAAKLVAIEEAEATLPPLKAAIAQIYEAKRRVDAAREGVLAGLAPAEDTREVFIALSTFDHKRRAAESIPMAEIKAPDGIVPDGQHELATALAQLGPVGPWLDTGAPPQDDPHYVNPSRMGSPI
jgi:hypothetical protein